MEPVERAALRFCEALAEWRGKPELETVSFHLLSALWAPPHPSSRPKNEPLAPTSSPLPPPPPSSLECAELSTLFGFLLGHVYVVQEVLANAHPSCVRPATDCDAECGAAAVGGI